MIEAVGLTKRYGSTVAVNDLSFTVQPGTVTGFLGPNGAGKSTTMRMILGLDRPTAGTVRVDGKDYRELTEPLRTVGALIDAKWVHPNRSAHAHLRWLARSNRIPVSRVDEVLEMVGLTAVAKRRAGGFSLGMSQRLGIAAALLGDPKILLFDEPVNGLDPEGIHWIRRFMRQLADEGRTVFVSSHLLSEMALTAENLVVVGKGELIAQCSTEEFVAGAGTGSLKVRSPHAARLRELLVDDGRTVLPFDAAKPDTIVVTGADTDQIGELAAAHQLVLHELSPQQGSLEEAFMQLTSQAVEYQTDFGGVLATAGEDAR
ncbi:ABC transporter ATP-binding protein [Saccharopolyspora gloriosae]|uniref:ABC-2 type transport system ATP-binding protein n=1 Tax=Saccharopolyspora gloriosae TaxID=455344 RepID=A0A840NRW0_9PSEU|nr:ABC transporter ATP-binding protein [Saccharopolyspora gloriosae]MBB5072685.1 ABC-2 type transport system ATP-binding protein [Saccharopolyspora gloriosae]